MSDKTRDELVAERDAANRRWIEANCQQDEASRRWNEAERLCDEADRRRDEAYRQMGEGRRRWDEAYRRRDEAAYLLTLHRRALEEYDAQHNLTWSRPWRRR